MGFSIAIIMYPRENSPVYAEPLESPLESWKNRLLCKDGSAAKHLRGVGKPYKGIRRLGKKEALHNIPKL